MPNDTEANGIDRIVHTLDLNDLGMEDVPVEARTRVKEEVAQFLEEEILRDVSNGTSPVQGEGRFRRLSKDYAEDKGGGRTSNLELEGDLLSDFFVKKTRGNKVKLGHEGSETPKSDGHNQLSSKAKEWARRKGFPRRRYIPDEGQQFKRRILDGIRNIIDEATVARPSRRRADGPEVEVEPTEVLTGATEQPLTETSITIDEVFTESGLDAFLRRIGRG